MPLRGHAVALLASAALAQDIPGIEICTAERDMVRRTSCLQSNVNFFSSRSAKAATAKRNIDAARREIAELKRQIVDLQKTVEELKKASKTEPEKVPK